MLTARQSQTIEVIRDYLQEHGHAPTLEEIGQRLGIRSKGAVHRLVQALVDKGQLVREGATWRGLRLLDRDEPPSPSLPLLGRIAAGRPIEAIPGEEQINLADFLMGPNRYALRVLGESMVDAGILDGDTVIIEHCNSAPDGEIVVALIDDQEATLKRLKRHPDGRIELIAENAAMPSLLYAAERVRIQGVVVGQLRSYRRGSR